MVKFKYWAFWRFGSFRFNFSKTEWLFRCNISWFLLAFTECTIDGTPGLRCPLICLVSVSVVKSPPSSQYISIARSWKWFIFHYVFLYYLFPNTRVLAFTRQLKKRSFTWSTGAIHLHSSSAFLCQLKFWFAKKLKMNLCIAPTDVSFCKYWDKAKILVVFKRWCTCLI